MTDYPIATATQHTAGSVAVLPKSATGMANFETGFLDKGFLDAAAKHAVSEPTAENLRHLGRDGRDTPEYLSLLARVLDAFDRGSSYAGRTADEADTIDRITRAYGSEDTRDPDVVTVAAKYRVPVLCLAHPDVPEDRSTDQKLLAISRKTGCHHKAADFTRRAQLESRAECILTNFERHNPLSARLAAKFPRMEAQARMMHAGQWVYERALWYREIPNGTCPGDKRKRQRHTEATRRIMTDIIVTARGRNAPADFVRVLELARTYTATVIEMGKVPESETEPLVADVVTRAQRVLDSMPRELPAPAPDEGTRIVCTPEISGVGAVVTDEQASADDTARAREVAIGAIRRKLGRSPDANDSEVWQAVGGKYRAPLADVRAEVIAEARKTE